MPNEIISQHESVILESSWNSLRNIIQKHSKITKTNLFNRTKKLKKLGIFAMLAEGKLLQLSQVIAKQTYKQGDIILLENTIGKDLFIIAKGRVKIQFQDKPLRELDEGNCFGELSLLNDSKRSATAIALTSQVECYILKKNDFLSMIDEYILELLKRKISLENTSVKLSHLYYLSYLGKGKISNVFLVHNSSSVYAIKCVSKKILERQQSLCKYMLSEKQILLTLDHPFIVKLVRTLKNEHYFFFLFEHLNGKIFEDYLLNKKSKKNITETLFYTACMLLMIDYMSKRKIAHRDIKPTNMMIDSKGYLKLIDFGTAKTINDFTHTVIGTPHFMAPEILSGKGYTYSCDYWSVGVCMYLIYYGVHPLGNNLTDIMDIYKEIQNK